jgi:haloalkane dehalogenase
LKTGLLISWVVIAVAGIVFSGIITRDGERVVPEGEGSIPLDAGDFEAFPLPDYAAKYVTDEYKSYFVEVEPGPRFTYLKWDSVFPSRVPLGI